MVEAQTGVVVEVVARKCKPRLRPEITFDEAWCKLLVGIANRWVRDAQLSPRNYSDKLDKWRVGQAQVQALHDFSDAVVDPSTSWIVVAVAGMRNMPQRTILNALLDRARLPRDYHYSPAREEQCASSEAA